MADFQGGEIRRHHIHQTLFLGQLEHGIGITARQSGFMSLFGRHLHLIRAAARMLPSAADRPT